MLLVIPITLIIFSVAMIITAKGIERKENSTIECELREYCDVERLKQCSVKESSINYLAISGNPNDIVALSKVEKKPS